mgnify:CR=1 FL=1
MRWILLTTTLIAIVPLLLTACFHDPLSISDHEGFEAGLGDWEQGADVPDDPNNPGHPVAWSISGSTEQAAEGSRSAKFELDGSQDDGTIWLVRAFDVPANQSVNVDLDFQLWSPSQSMANTLINVAAYAGPQPPEVEQDFNTERRGNRVEGWDVYDYRFSAQSGSGGQVWVAFGISVVWETQVVYYIDDVNVEIDRPGIF